MKLTLNWRTFSWSRVCLVNEIFFSLWLYYFIVDKIIFSVFCCFPSNCGCKVKSLIISIFDNLNWSFPVGHKLFVLIYNTILTHFIYCSVSDNYQILFNSYFKDSFAVSCLNLYNLRRNWQIFSVLRCGTFSQECFHTVAFIKLIRLVIPTCGRTNP